MLKSNVIEHSHFPYASPLLLVKKADGKLRPVVDFRRLNKNTRFDAEPIPNPEDIFAKLSGNRYFSKLDFCKGYWQGENCVRYISGFISVSRDAIWSGERRCHVLSPDAYAVQ